MFINCSTKPSRFTRNYQIHIIKRNLTSNSGCGRKIFFSGCHVLVINEYIQRYGRVWTYMHWKRWQKYFQKFTEIRWCRHTSEQVAENDKVAIKWDMPTYTNRENKANRPDIDVRDHQYKNSF